MTMSLQHAIYGSASGLDDYRILAASDGVDESTGRDLAYYSSLGGSAKAEEFDPIFSFFCLGQGRWAFSRTIHLTPTTRGSDYLVHAILLTESTLARHDFRPFVFSDAGLFANEKPLLHTRLAPLEWSADDRQRAIATQVDPPTVAFLLRGLAKGSLRLRVPNGTNATAICRAAHESLPPSDRMKTTFCTRFSYRRALDFRLAAFVAADAGIVDEQNATNANVVVLPANPVEVNDAFSRWLADVVGHPELELFGPSILDKPGNALQSIENVRQLRRWTRGSEVSSDLRGLQPAAALVLRPENRDRASIRPLLPGALAIDLCNRIAKALPDGGLFDESLQLARDVGPVVRAGAAEWIAQLPAARLEAWLVKVLLMLPDATSAEVTDALEECSGGRGYLAELSANTATFRAFLGAVMPVLRDRFGGKAGDDLARVARALDNTDATPMFIGLMEATAREAPNEVKERWLIAIIRDIAQPAGLQNVVARLVLTYDLVGRMAPEEITRHARAFMAFPQQLQRALLADPPARLIAALGSVFSTLLRSTRWNLDNAMMDALRSTITQMTVLAHDRKEVTADEMTLIAFLSSTSRQVDVRAAVRDAVVEAITLLARRKPTPVQAALLVRALQSLAHGGKVRVSTATARLLRRAARRRNPVSPWNALRRHLRLRTLLEAQAS